MNITINGKENIKVFSRIEWGGDTRSSARYIDVETTLNNIECGDTAELYNNDGTRLFIGKVFNVSRSAEEETTNFRAYDNAIYLNKNNLVKNFYEVTPSEIFKQVLGEIGLNVGVYPDDKLKCTFPAIDRSAYSIIMGAYTLQNAKDNIVYSVVSEDNFINVIEQGTIIQNFVLSSGINVRSGHYSATIENMINKVVTYKTEKEVAQILGTVQSEEDIKKYGIFQQVQQQTEDTKAIVDVNKILTKIEQRGSLTVNGMNDLISGYTVVVAVENTKLVGAFIIEADMHVWEADDYYCNIDLAF
ncbi:MAG: XkdQ/YqbQ family protein, partial [Fusobacteriaceae bacterium]